MGLFDTLSRRDKSTLFPERQTLSSMAWTSSSDIADWFKADSRDIFVIRDNDRMAEKLESEGRHMKPALKLYSFNGHICYLLKEEQRLYDLMQEITQHTHRVEESRPAPVEEMREDLTAKISTADQEQRKADFLARMGLAEDPVEDLTSREPTDIENRWAEEKLTEELAEIEAQIQETDKILNGTAQPEGAGDQTQRKKRKSLGRTNQIKTRLTDSELVKFQRRVKKSGLTQGEYLRSVALTGKIVIEERSMADVALLDELAMIRAELGRQGGLLKMVIKPNEGQRELAPEEWAELIATVRGMERMKKRLADMEVKITHGNSETPDEQERPVR